MIINVDGKRYQIKLRSAFSRIRTAKQFEAALRSAYTLRYGMDAANGKSLFRMDTDIGMISTCKPLTE